MRLVHVYLLLMVYLFCGVSNAFDCSEGLYCDYEKDFMWQDQRISVSRYDYLYNAVKYCSDLTIGDYSEWRLPSVQELLTLIDYDRHEPASDAEFKNESIGDYWSSTPFIDRDSYYWYVDFLFGFTSVAHAGKPNLIRCVHRIE